MLAICHATDLEYVLEFPEFSLPLPNYVRSVLTARVDFQTDSRCCTTGLMRSILTAKYRPHYA